MPRFLLFLSIGRVPGMPRCMLLFPSGLVVHSQGQRWPTGNSTFVCAMKGSSQRTAFTHVISFDFPQLPLGKVGVIVPTLQMRGLRLRGARQVPKITGLASGPEFESKSHALARHQSLGSASPQAYLHSQKAVCLHPQGELLAVDNIGEIELSPFLVVMNSYLEAKTFHSQGFKSLNCMPHLDWYLKSVKLGRPSICPVLKGIRLCLLFWVLAIS